METPSQTCFFQYREYKMTFFGICFILRLKLSVKFLKQWNLIKHVQIFKELPFKSSSICKRISDRKKSIINIKKTTIYMNKNIESKEWFWGPYVRGSFAPHKLWYSTSVHYSFIGFLPFRLKVLHPFRLLDLITIQGILTHIKAAAYQSDGNWRNE